MTIAYIIPAYNEKVSIYEFVKGLADIVEMPSTLIFVDDSRDGVSSQYAKMALDEKLNNLISTHFIYSEYKQGRGKAVLRGLDWAIKNTDCDIFVECDSDGSHPPDMVIKVAANLHGNDYVIGSRYLSESTIQGWPFTRRIFSSALNKLLPRLFNVHISDWTNGLRAYTRESTRILISTPQSNSGFIYLSEQILVLAENNCRVLEVPINFVNRIHGSSSVGFAEITNSLLGILKLFRSYSN